MGRLAWSVVFTLAPRAAVIPNSPRVHALLDARIVCPAREQRSTCGSRARPDRRRRPVEGGVSREPAVKGEAAYVAGCVEQLSCDADDLGRPGSAQRTDRRSTEKRAPSPRGSACVGAVGEMVVQRSSGQRARDALDRIAGGALREQLVGEIARKFRHRSADDVEEAFHEAYARALAGCRWRDDREVYGWLRRAMVNWLIDRDRRERRELVADTTAERSSMSPMHARSRSGCSAAARSAGRYDRFTSRC